MLAYKYTLQTTGLGWLLVALVVFPAPHAAAESAAQRSALASCLNAVTRALELQPPERIEPAYAVKPVRRDYWTFHFNIAVPREGNAGTDYVRATCSSGDGRYARKTEFSRGRWVFNNDGNRGMVATLNN